MEIVDLYQYAINESITLMVTIIVLYFSYKYFNLRLKYFEKETLAAVKAAKWKLIGELEIVEDNGIKKASIVMDVIENTTVSS